MFACSAAAVAAVVVGAPAAAEGVACFLETMSITVEAMEDPASGLRSDPFEVVRDPPAAKNGFSGLAASAGAADPGSATTPST